MRELVVTFDHEAENVVDSIFMNGKKCIPDSSEVSLIDEIDAFIHENASLTIITGTQALYEKFKDSSPEKLAEIAFVFGKSLPCETPKIAREAYSVLQNEDGKDSLTQISVKNFEAAKVDLPNLVQGEWAPLLQLVILGSFCAVLQLQKHPLGMLFLLQG